MTTGTMNRELQQLHLEKEGNSSRGFKIKTQGCPEVKPEVELVIENMQPAGRLQKEVSWRYHERSN